MTALNIMITNPLGLLALLGVPVVVLIHFFQRRAKRATIPTLFLLQATQREVSSGRKLERLKHNIPLWLQILAVLAITWFLIQPRYIHSQSTQRIAVVLDSSASMEVFREKIEPAIQQHFRNWRNHAKHTELWLFESDASAPRLYHGNSLPELLNQLENWHAYGGAVDPTHVLRIGRSLCGQEGLLVYISDTPPEKETELAYSAEALSIGEPVPNCGFTGYDFILPEEIDSSEPLVSSGNGELLWQCTLRNYGSQSAQRTWFIETDEKQRSEDQLVTIAAGQTVTLEGSFPEGAQRCSIHLEQDAFVADDVLHLVRPLEKPVYIDNIDASSAGVLPASGQWAQLIDSISYCQTPAGDEVVDIRIQAVDPTDISQPLTEWNGHTISYLTHQGEEPPYRDKKTTAGQHDLVTELLWETLLIRAVPTAKALTEDEVLLWQGDVPLLILRYNTIAQPVAEPSAGNEEEATNFKTTKHLICNFDPELSNAWRQEAFIVMLYRYIESVREGKFFYERKVLEANQEVSIALPPLKHQEQVSLTSSTLFGDTLSSRSIPLSHVIRAPKEPSFFEVSMGEQRLLSGSSYFADTREADFADCASSHIAAPQQHNAIDRHSREDHLWRYVILFVLACLLFSWHFTKTSSRKKTI